MIENNRFGGVSVVLIACSVALFVSSCVSPSSKPEEVATSEQSEPSTTGHDSSQDSAGHNVTPSSSDSSNIDPVLNNSADTKDGHEQSNQIQKEDSNATQHASHQNTITAECKQQPFVQYENQARDYIKKGWEATQAQRFGVGFRDAEEYKKWSDTSNQLFTKVSELCTAMSDCAKQGKTDSAKKCSAEADRFAHWQDLAKRFVEKVKTVETTQPPMLCSLNPSPDDLSQCFNVLADQIENTCQTAQCKETSICFRGVYFLDDAINQAKLACSYVGQKLSDCRGYVEETGRRQANFEQCLDKYRQLPVEILPVI